MDGIPTSLPELARAARITARAAAVGYDFPDRRMLFAKLSEELSELAHELFPDGKVPEIPATVDAPESLMTRSPIPKFGLEQESELGDVLFVLANIARRWGINPEEALRNSNAKFSADFEPSNRLSKQGKPIHEASLIEMEDAYQAAKRLVFRTMESHSGFETGNRTADTLNIWISAIRQNLPKSGVEHFEPETYTVCLSGSDIRQMGSCFRDCLVEVTALATVDKAVQTINGAQILVEMLIRLGTEHIFAYPGGCSMPLHQALREKRNEIRTILPRHEQGGCFAAQGIARSTGKVGVCMATSGPGATNLVTGIADAKLDSVPMVAITGQVPQSVIGSDAFQETPMVEVCRAITKHHYMITNIRDVARIVKEAFYIASTGRPGPVLIDFPKDVQLTSVPLSEVDFDPPVRLPGYRPEVRKPALEQVRQVLAAIRRSKRPVLYVGGGCITAEASEELTKFALRTGIPVAMTVMGLGCFRAHIHSHCICWGCMGRCTRTTPWIRLISCWRSVFGLMTV